jgi:hypothetical protein
MPSAGQVIGRKKGNNKYNNANLEIQQKLNRKIVKFMAEIKPQDREFRIYLRCSSCSGGTRCTRRKNNGAGGGRFCGGGEEASQTSSPTRTRGRYLFFPFHPSISSPNGP